MDFSELTSHKNSPKLNQKKVIEKKDKYFCKRPTKPVPRRPTRPAYKTKEVTNSLFSPPLLQGLGRAFCCKYLPNHDVTIILVDEEGEEYETKYLVSKTGLSGLWRTFSIAHNLLEGDVLVFHLIEECKFKVCIERAKGPSVIGTVALLNIAPDAEPIAKTISTLEGEERCEKLVQGTLSQGNGPMVLLDDHSKLHADQILNESDVNSGSDMLGKNRFLDSELREPIRKKYHELCRSQNCYLHKHVHESLNSQMVLGIIEQTVEIVDLIRASQFPTSCDDLERSDKILKCFEDLGMTVGFLRNRLKKLVKISYKQKKIEMKMLKRSKLKEDIRMLKLKLADAEWSMRNLDGVLEDLKVESQNNYAEVASASW